MRKKEEGNTTDDILSVEKWLKSKKGKVIFIPPRYPFQVPEFRSHLEEHSIELWRFWWEWWLKCNDCCCCCDMQPKQSSQSNLAIDLHLNHLYIYYVGLSHGDQISLGWTVSGATGQVTVKLEVKIDNGGYQNVTSILGTKVDDYYYPQLASTSAQNFLPPYRTYTFRATATDSTGQTSSELPVTTY